MCEETFGETLYMKNTISNLKPLGFHWQTHDPFLFCAHHYDHYPRGNKHQGPDASLEGRNIGQDFTQKDGWRMYHGQRVPGFPEHPHRGFETITIVLEGFVDHSDSLGAGGRYGEGDVQWMTAGSGMQHSEMFPCIHKDKPNTLHLFQIWLNLPARSKFVSPYYSMLWAEDIPVHNEIDPQGNSISVRIIAGSLGKKTAVPPPPDSWASNPENHISVWIITLAPGAVWTLPAGSSRAGRSLYYYKGKGLKAAETPIPEEHSFDTVPDVTIRLENGDSESCLLLLQGAPLNEPVVQYGPFVMTTEQEIQQAFKDYQETRFGGWPWKTPEPVHSEEAVRFATYGDGTREERK